MSHTESASTGTETTVAPLDDPTYKPHHPPIDGMIPDVVAKWGAASQVRWFARYSGTFKPQPYAVWERFYINSMLHRGQCCESCYEDGEWEPDHCCCRAERRGDVYPMSETT